MYAQGVTDENYLRGVQETDADGNVTFTSIFPAAYSGRWPHIHFEVYPSLADATAASGKLAHLAARAARGRLHAVYATTATTQSVQQPRPDLARDRHGLQRRLVPAARAPSPGRSATG